MRPSVPCLIALSPLACLALGCGGPSAMDAGLDAGEVPDAVSVDAGPTDTRADAGCTGTPGELVGTRAIETGNLPLLAWEGTDGEVALVDHHAPCAPAGRLIVLREVTAWSAHALWHVAHTAELAAIDDVTVIDLWAADEDAMPMRIERLGDVASRYDAPPDRVAVDPEEQLGALAISGIALPIVLVVDARTLHVERTMFDPRADEVEQAVHTVQAELRGERRPPPLDPVLVDGRFTRDRWDLVRDMAAPFVPPPSPSNAYADDARAAVLGEHLFEDTMLAPSGVSCRTCHQPSRGFTDGLVVGRGVADVTRNTPTAIGAAWARWPFWDGRTDSLWAQALGPIENPREMAGSRLFVAHRVADAYRAEYEAIFGALPALEDAARFPAEGAPGEPAWEAMTEDDRVAVTRVFVNVGKAIEAYERTLVPARGRLEDYADGAFDALTTAERDGLRAFLTAGCAQCHSGPMLTNGAFFSVAMPGVGEGAMGDQGRIAVLATLTGSDFRAQGPFSDDLTVPDPLEGVLAFPERSRGAFRTPTLRALSQTGPYGHAGTFGTLREVVEHYAHLRMPRTPDPRVIGAIDDHLLGFEDFRIGPIETFLRVF